MTYELVSSTGTVVGQATLTLTVVTARAVDDAAQLLDAATGCAHLVRKATNASLNSSRWLTLMP